MLKLLAKLQRTSACSEASPLHSCPAGLTREMTAMLADLAFTGLVSGGGVTLKAVRGLKTVRTSCSKDSQQRLTDGNLSAAGTLDWLSCAHIGGLGDTCMRFQLKTLLTSARVEMQEVEGRRPAKHAHRAGGQKGCLHLHHKPMGCPTLCKRVGEKGRRRWLLPSGP